MNQYLPLRPQPSVNPRRLSLWLLTLLVLSSAFTQFADHAKTPTPAATSRNNFGGLTPPAELKSVERTAWLQMTRRLETGVTGSLATARRLHTATLLPSGKVLVAGGYNDTAFANAELYDPVTGTWNATGSLATARYGHTATLLPSGKVLVAGGINNTQLASAELYDPATGTWSNTGALLTARYLHTATLLPSGKVLVAGGANLTGPNQNDSLASAELYDPATGTWSATGALATARQSHTVTLLPSGKTLAAGGYIPGGTFLASAELYDPATGTWSNTGALAAARSGHTATLLPSGKVLAAGGISSDVLTSAELYDPVTGVWSSTGVLAAKRSMHTATLLPSGKVLVAGGDGGIFTFLASMELYDPVAGTWSAAGTLATAHALHTATLLPSGKVLIVDGYNQNAVASTELYDPAAGTWSITGDLITARVSNTMTLLPSGKVLVAAGYGYGGALNSTESYDPAMGTWSSTGALATARLDHTATLLPSGKVLVVGGYSFTLGYLKSAELYDPATGTWSATGSLNVERNGHTATLLPSGKVLVAGGNNTNSGVLTSAELYDPEAGTWSATGSLATARSGQTATLLPSGKVLAAAGSKGVSYLASAELYDPATGTWSNTGSLIAPRDDHTATLLPSGKVLVAGGFNPTTLASAELYDPATGTFGNTGSLITARDAHTATLLRSGKVLVVGGDGGSGALASAELYDPATGSWGATGALATARSLHKATLLPSGQVLATTGVDVTGGFPARAELYDVGLGFNPAWQPVLASATSPLLTGQPLAASGSQFKGVSEASGGNFQNSATNYPLVQLLSLVNEQSVFLPVNATAGWSATSFTSTPVTVMAPNAAGFARGWALATVFANGIPSTAKLIVVGQGGVAVGPSLSGVKITDPLTCTGGGNTVSVTATVANPNLTTQTASFTANLPPQLLALPGTCVVNTGVCSVVNSSTVTWAGALAGGQSVTISYQAQIADGTPAGTQLCAVSTASFAGGGTATVSACTTLNCPAVGPGSLLAANSPANAQKAGSVLVYNIYTSSSDPIRQNTRLNITNTDSARGAYVHLFFVDGTSCSVADSFLCLTPNQTTSFLASDLDPGTTGYLVAVATDAAGCPINFNSLIGDEYVKFQSGHAANIGAEAITAIAGGLPACSTNSSTAVLVFDGISYNVVPHVLAADNVPSRADGNDTLLILNRIGGNLGTGAGTLGTIFGIFYDDTERSLSFQFTPGTCQFRSSLSNNFPRIAPRFEQFIPAGRSGWFKLWWPGLFGMTGAVINFNANAVASAGAFNQGHNLHALTNTNTASYVIPVFPPSC